MMMGDILTISQYDLPVKIVIFNNSSLGFVAMEMKVAGLPPFGTHLKNPDFAKMAEAIGIKGIRAEKPEDISPRSEEHTSELQSLMRISYAVFYLKKKNKIHTTETWINKC